MVEEGVEVLLHLDGVVLRLRDAEDAHLAVLPGAVLLQQEGQQHEEAAVVDDPPDVDVAADLVPGLRVPLDALGDQEGHLGRGGVADGVDEDPPGVLLLAPPAVGPAEHDRVRLHAAQARGLDAVHGENLLLTVRKYFVLKYRTCILV